jgi:pimeloyl-ACP methyl ester carboxylesterase
MCAPVTFARLHVVPKLGASLEAHPKLRVDLVRDDRRIALVAEYLDAALVARKLTPGERFVVARLASRARRGVPRTPAALLAHAAIIDDQSAGGEAWGSAYTFRRRRVMAAVTYRTAAVDGLPIFSREAGAAAAPHLLLLHGFPSASHMFRDLIPFLADRYHVIAPDLPGFGQSSMPPRSEFSYTFDNLAGVIDRFTAVVGLDRFAVYVFDYGAPVGFRLAMRHPERITAIVSQNGNAYEEGLSDGWNPIRAYWEVPSQTNREALRGLLSPETTRWQYTHGVPDPTAVSPDGYALDTFYLTRPGADEVQLDLFGDYKSNVALYPAFQDYFRTYQPPFLAVWGTNDPFFLPPGAEAFKRDMPGAVVRFVDTGHFALETHVEEIAAAIRDFLAP